jgi:predicted NBD/HSP70 family sugar kinase
MKILTVDVGGSNVKLLASEGPTPRKFPSGPGFTPQQLVDGLAEHAADWRFDAITIGLPTPIRDGQPILEPRNLGKGWMGFDYAQALGRPVRLINDAAMQALGSYEGDTMLFLGLGTGLGSALIIDWSLAPLELAHLPYRKGRTYEDYLGRRGLERLGSRRWERHVHHVVKLLREALVADYVILGGGNSKKLGRLPRNARLGDNRHAFVGGFRLWEDLPARRQNRPARRKQPTSC